MADYGQQIEFLLAPVRADGVALAGGKVYFYEAGTNVAKTVWTDRGKTTPATQPYTLDANATALLFGDGLYRVVITNSAGAIKFTRDYVYYSPDAFDSHTVDGFHASQTPGVNEIPTIDASGNITLAGAINKADTLKADGQYRTASVTPGVNQIPVLNASSVMALPTADHTIGGNTIWHAGNDGASSGLDADKLDGKHWVQVLNGSVSIGSGAAVSMSTNRAGGSHKLYLYSVYNTIAAGGWEVSHGYHPSNSYATIRQQSTGTGDQLYIYNGQTETHNFAYQVWVWE